MRLPLFSLTATMLAFLFATALPARADATNQARDFVQDDLGVLSAAQRDHILALEQKLQATTGKGILLFTFREVDGQQLQAPVWTRIRALKKKGTVVSAVWLAKRSQGDELAFNILHDLNGVQNMSDHDYLTIYTQLEAGVKRGDLGAALVEAVAGVAAATDFNANPIWYSPPPVKPTSKTVTLA